MNMSFMLTKDQIKQKTKTVTRRLGWKKLKTGTIINACEKCQGLKKGEKVNVICRIRITDVRQEQLNKITNDDCTREGFPHMTPSEFIQMFKTHMKCEDTEIVSRIEFEYITD